MAEPRASATCEVEIDGTPIACTRQALAAGEPTILDPLTITWGRRSAWDQPDAGSAAFVIQDQRTAPQPIIDTIHVGSKIDVYAEAPNPDPQPEVVMDQKFQTMSTGDWDTDRYAVESVASTIRRTNLMTDPSMTTTTGKNAGGSATIAVSAAWAQFGTTSISITPNGSNNSSALFPLGLSGMTVFTAGTTYTISAYIRITAVQTGTLHANARRIVFYQDTGSGLTIAATSTAAPNTIGVHRVSLTYTVPVGATQALIAVANGSSVAAQVMWVDGLLIQTGSTLDVYFDGTTTRTGYTYEWTGTANASTSNERYAVTDPGSKINIFDASSTWPPGQGTQSALLYSLTTRARFLIPPARFGSPWVRDVRPVQPGETWTYSFMARLPAGTTATFTTRGFSSSQKTGESIQLTVDGGLSRQITGTGNWETYTGTIANATLPGTPRWAVFALLVFPDNMDLAAGAGMPAVDAITYTAPASETERVQVWAGRVTELDAQQITANGVIEINVTGTGELAEVENVSIGDEPWDQETIMDRIDRVISLIPVPVEDFSVSRDVFNLAFISSVAARDIDAQPALGLLRDYAAMVLGVVWPVSVPGARNHAWIENTMLRGSGWSGPVGTISACDLPRDAVRITQSADQVITVVDVTWLELIVVPESETVEHTVTTVDITAAATYGTRRLAITTEYVTEQAATDTGENALDVARASDWGVAGMQFDTKHVDNTSGQAQTLLMLLLNSARRPGSELTITDLPEWIPESGSSGYVEGGTIVYTGGWWRFDLAMSAGGSGS